MLVAVAVASSLVIGQPKYRTFSQAELATKKVKKIGKAEFVRAWFTFRNDSGYAVNSLHAKFNGHLTAVEDSGGFTAISPEKKNGIKLTGRSVAGHDSVLIRVLLKKDHPDARADKWWWDTSGTRIGPEYKHLDASSSVVLYREPDGGNILEFLYKHETGKPKGLIVGVKTDTPGVGWIRYKKGERHFFPHTDSSRCFDYIKDKDHGNRPFVRELKDPHVNKHNNHLLGELHALMLAVIANDSGVTAPFDGGVTRLGDLMYMDAGNPTDPSNNKTIRQIIALTDSGLTYCSHFTASFYFGQDSGISRINRAFDGPIIAASIHPLQIEGTHTLPAFLHPNPSAAPVTPTLSRHSILDQNPDQYTIYQNYPNPFNPTTTIEFNLAQASLVTLKVYNVLGQEVATLVNRETMEEGEQSVEFDAGALASGIYFYRIMAVGSLDNNQHFQATKRMLLIK